MKPVVLLVGMNHLDQEHTQDVVTSTATDVLSERRQTEMEALVEQFVQFAPTKVCLEYPKTMQGNLTRSYKSYLHSESTLSKNEREQIGYRLAKKMDHETVWGVDWNGESSHDAFGYAAEHEPDLFKRLIKPVQASVAEADDYFSEHTMSQFVSYLNEPSHLNLMHQFHLNLLQIGDDENPVGALWLANYWYFRNVMIYKAILELAATEERLFVLYGASHIYPIKQLLEDSDLVTVELASAYLTKGE
ncbi:hypothetical protein JOC54_003064 [Alkalihalobacillus xiaoxiensis]|uniref:Uncharacterized protein n=1 Tax=Shouchella xiaoxiensis TaxID=766895 RepID=A0ABS2SZ97_9BACI|nr:DUF5694 domain-containing protein [Shouchella xiaoxiensis]MBM7839784.1 hypothetical protein [Shouchella xiaoxiensis]